MKNQERFLHKISEVIADSVEEGNLTLIDIVGGLEIAKMRFWRMAEENREMGELTREEEEEE